ncbi:cation diffusion facilitator family transporter [Dactylosporangium sp. AC04546]|uniref:cation diffusion facilitator family transporter n=1 Tax=Dactylosporangium sp. AC04546 TaxID=2862460 RepID=UPI001EDE2DC7|nr:cation diffusion facilitator family transporter [Dactylosporangium sp. AC04546]WVK82826.1 cation diffusion facilitator family transporter [Dactylosporangium sp. AC04546]
MGHDHDHHQHGPREDADRRWLSLALALIVGFMAVEVVVGLLVGSLALLSDAAHMLSDAAAIALALFATRLAARPPSGGYTFGLKRAEILSAQANGLTLLLLSVWITYEAITRLVNPPPVGGGAVLVTALAGVAVNLVAVWAMGKANRASLNIEGAFQHVLTDLFAFVAAAVAGLVVLLTGFDRADAIASLVVAALMIRSGVQLVRESGRIFMEAAPSGMDPATLGRELSGVPGVVELHDLHVWQVTSGYPALSAHVLVDQEGDCHAVRAAIETRLRERWEIGHTTLQVDHCEDDPHCVDSHGAAYRAAG